MGVKRSFRRPALVVSRCIEFDPVRYNGDMISCPLVRSMKPFVTFILVCPEDTERGRDMWESEIS